MASGKARIQYMRDWQDDDHLLLLKSYAREEKDYKGIAERIGIARTTLVEWRKKSKDIADAIKNGREELVAKLEESAIRLANGFPYEETKTTYDKNGDVTETIVTAKTAPPNLGSLVFLLTNLAPEKYQNTQRVDITKHEQLDADLKKKFAQMDEKQLDELARKRREKREAAGG